MACDQLSMTITEPICLKDRGDAARDSVAALLTDDRVSDGRDSLRSLVNALSGGLYLSPLFDFSLKTGNIQLLAFLSSKVCVPRT